MSRPEIYADNAAAMMSSIGTPTEPVPGLTRVSLSRGTRLILREAAKHDVAELLEAEAGNKRVTLEDSFSSLTGEPGENMQVRRMPVMVRPAGAVQARAAGQGVRVALVGDLDELATAERIIIDGFPVVPNPPGPILPQSVLQQPEWKVWLAHRDEVPAAATYTYDDGVAVGVYMLATLPEHRSAGLGRAIMAAVIAAYPNRPIALVATEAGAPLYRSQGFVEVSTATWYIRAVID